MKRDDLGVGQMKEKWRQEQWETVRALKLRNDHVADGGVFG